MDYKGDLYYIEKVLIGNSQAFAELVDRHKDNVYTLAQKICGNPEDAEEVAQDSFIKVFRSLKSFRFKSSFHTWLYRIVYNTAITRLRQKRTDILKIEDFPVDAVDFLREGADEQYAEMEYKRALIRFALQKIDPDQRALISLHYWQELSIDEIASVSGLSHSNVKIRLFRARNRLKEIIKEVTEKEVYQHERI